MRKCEKIIFSSVADKNKHYVFQRFLEEERKLKQKANKVSK